MNPLPPLWVLGNPENRRVQAFLDAARAQGVEPRVLAHAEVLANPACLEQLDDGAIVRLESLGEHPGVEAALLERGFLETEARYAHTDAERNDPRQLLAPAQVHRGTLSYLAQLQEAGARWRWWTPPDEVARLFDKRRTSALWASRGIPVPETLPVPPTRQALLEQMRLAGWKQAVLKASFGSSASCLAVIGQGRTMTTLRRTERGWFNSLQVQRVGDSAAQDGVYAFLLEQEPHLERLVPKARHDGAWFDLRILTIAGEPRFWIVRQSRHPITNLHLGGWRGDAATLEAQVGPARWEAAMQTCRDVAACHDAFHLGIDLLFEPGFTAHRVIEANAFGDLLPRLTRDGLDVYGFELRTWLDRR